MLQNVKTSSAERARMLNVYSFGYRVRGVHWYPRKCSLGNRRAVERLALGNVGEHMGTCVPAFCTRVHKMFPSVQNVPGVWNVLHRNAGNILRTRVQNAGTRVPGKRNVGNNTGTNHGVGVHVFLWGRGCMTSFTPQGTTPKTFRCLPRFRSASDPLFLYGPLCPAPWLHIGLLCFLGLRVMGQVIVQCSV